MDTGLLSPSFTEPLALYGSDPQPGEEAKEVACAVGSGVPSGNPGVSA